MTCTELTKARLSVADLESDLALRRFVAGDERGAITCFRSAKMAETVLWSR